MMRNLVFLAALLGIPAIVSAQGFYNSCNFQEASIYAEGKLMEAKCPRKWTKDRATEEHRQVHNDEMTTQLKLDGCLGNRKGKLVALEE